jgi:hypothetical protein
MLGMMDHMKGEVRLVQMADLPMGGWNYSSLTDHM